MDERFAHGISSPYSIYSLSAEDVPTVMGLDVNTDDRTGEVTLVFSLGAARALANPTDTFADARKWSRYVGIVANEAAAVEAFTRDHGITNDYALRSWDKWGTLGDIYADADTPRHVFVGTSTSDRRVATHVGYEYRSIREAAERAEWDLDKPGDSAESDTAGVVDRLRQAVIERLR